MIDNRHIKSETLDSLPPGTRLQLKQLLQRGYSVERIAVLTELPWVVVQRIRERGLW